MTVEELMKVLKQVEDKDTEILIVADHHGVFPLDDIEFEWAVQGADGVEIVAEEDLLERQIDEYVRKCVILATVR